MSELLTIDDFDSFKFSKGFSAESMNEPALKTILNLNEKTQLEPFISSSIHDLNDTPHVPVELVDIITTKVTRHDSNHLLAAYRHHSISLVITSNLSFLPLVQLLHLVVTILVSTNT